MLIKIFINFSLLSINKVSIKNYVSIFILDYFTTFKIISFGGVEYNPIMAYFIKDPFLLGFLKLIAANAIICIIKIMYDIIQNIYYTHYNIIFIYIAFAIPSGLTLAIVLQNLWVLYIILI